MKRKKRFLPTFCLNNGNEKMFRVLNHETKSVKRKNEEEKIMSEYSEAKQKVLKYIQEGSADWSGSERPYVGRDKLRSMLLKAGYTELALGRWRRTHTWTDEEENTVPQEEKHSNTLQFFLEKRNRFMYPEGWYSIEELLQLLENYDSDYPKGEDVLRNRLLIEFDRFEVLKKELRDSGKEWFSLESWRYQQENGKLLFWLNPFEQDIYGAGWYSLDELSQWLNDKGPVIKK